MTDEQDLAQMRSVICQIERLAEAAEALMEDVECVYESMANGANCGDTLGRKEGECCQTCAYGNPMGAGEFNCQNSCGSLVYNWKGFVRRHAGLTYSDDWCKQYAPK